MHPQTFLELMFRDMCNWSINGSTVDDILVLENNGMRLVTKDRCHYSCHFTGDHPHRIQDIPRLEALSLGAPTRPERIWVYDPLNSKPGQEPDIVLLNEQALEENDRTIAKYRKRRDQRAQTAREAYEAAREERQAAYQRDHVEPMNEILAGKTVEKITFTDGGFSIMVGELLIRVTPDVRAVSMSEFGTDHAVGLRVSFGDKHFLSTHDLDDEEE